MASTYSNLKIQLMTTGENSTTWGDVTNVNLGTALEEAIVGSDDVTFASANVTLTLSNTNASQTARNMRLRCTGTTGGSTRNLVVPAIEKPYIVQNDCADSIVIKTSAGNGITVPAGKTMWVYNNGTDVVDATTHLTSLTLASALPVLSGGTGSNTASGARTNLGLGTIATQNSNAVTITGGSITGITDLAVADGGTGASTAADARTNLGLGSLAVLSSINNSNWSGTALAVANGGTGATDAATARTNLGAGTGNGSVTSVATTGTVNGITLTGSVTTSGTLTLGGTLSGVSLTTQVTGTLPIANGGTNATSAATALTSLGAYPAANPSGFTSNTGTVTSVAGTGTVNGLTLTGSVTTSGSLTLGGTLSGVSLTTQVSGTLPIGNGGTNATTAGGARTSLGSTTVGGNMFTLTNPSAVTFPRFNADNTVSALDASTFRSAIGAGTSSTSGTVTSVAMSVPAFLSISGSPITSSGTLAVTLSGTALPVANGGTGATTLTGVLKGNGTSAFSVATAGTDYVAPGGALGTPSSGNLANCTFPTLNQNTTGSSGSCTGNAATATTATTATTAGSVTNAVTFNTSGGAAAGTTFNGSAARTIDYSTVGAYAATNPSGFTSNAGTVTSVAMSVPAFLSVSGSPVTSTGTLAVTLSGTALPVANGGTGATTLTGIVKGNGTSAFSAASAGTDYVAPGGALGTPSSGTLTNCTFPTLNQNTTGSAASLATTNFSIVESGGVLYIKYGATNIAKIDSSGNFTSLADVTAFGTI